MAGNGGPGDVVSALKNSFVPSLFASLRVPLQGRLLVVNTAAANLGNFFLSFII